MAREGEAVVEAGGDLDDRSLPRGVSVVAAIGDGLEVKNCERGLIVDMDLEDLNGDGWQEVLVLVGVAVEGREGNAVSSSIDSAIVEFDGL